MTGPGSETDVRQLFPGIKQAKVGCHEVSRGIVLEVIESTDGRSTPTFGEPFPSTSRPSKRGSRPARSTPSTVTRATSTCAPAIRSSTAAWLVSPFFDPMPFPWPRSWTRRWCRTRQRVVLPLASAKMKNYCRYWADSIAKLYVCERASALRERVGAGPVQIVAPKLKLPFQREAADLLKAHAPVRIQKKARLVRGRSLNATGFVFGGQQVGRIVRDFSEHLQSVIPAAAPEVGSSGLLYVSRNEARMRRLLNEEAILPALRDLGFEIIRPGEMPLATQVEKFRNARVVLAPHGAGLTNILFCRPGTTLIEIFPRGGVHGSMFMRIASQRDFDYYFAVGDSVATPASETNPNNADIVLDAERFVSFVRQVI